MLRAGDIAVPAMQAPTEARVKSLYLSWLDNNESKELLWRLSPPTLLLQRMMVCRMQLEVKPPVCCRSNHLIRDQVTKAGGCGPGAAIRCGAAVLCQHKQHNTICERSHHHAALSSPSPSRIALPSCLMTMGLVCRHTPAILHASV